MKRAVAGSRSYERSDVEGLLDVMNEKTLSDIETIRRVLVKERVRIHDIQCLFLSDGSIIIADPQHVNTEKHDLYSRYMDRSYDSMDEFYFLRRIEATARYAIAVRSGVIERPEIDSRFDLFHVASKWAHALGIIDVCSNM